MPEKVLNSKNNGNPKGDQKKMKFSPKEPISSENFRCNNLTSLLSKALNLFELSFSFN